MRNRIISELELLFSSFFLSFFFIDQKRSNGGKENKVVFLEQRLMVAHFISYFIDFLQYYNSENYAECDLIIII